MKKEQKREKRRRSKQDKGITLVALVVTIIILLILAGVTLSGALSENGLFQRAKKAVNEYKKAEEVESKAIEEIGDEIDRITFDYNDYVGCYVDGYTPKENGNCTISGTSSGFKDLAEDDQTRAKAANLNIKDDGSQEFSTETMGWRIWDYNKSTNTIRLISSKPTKQGLLLNGANGYNNGVWAINEICRECYGNKDVGATATSLKRTDIQKVSTYDYKNEIGNEKTLNSYSYPRMWEDHDKNWTEESDKECTSWEYEGNGDVDGTLLASDSITYRQSDYKHSYEKNEFIKDKYYNLLFKYADWEVDGAAYWLAGRCVDLGENNCGFGIQRVKANMTDHDVMGCVIYSNGRRLR